MCGRTILKGEQIHQYLTPQRQRIRVCVLCRSRAESSGWIPVSMAHTMEDEQPRRSPGTALRQRFTRAAARARSAARTRRETEPEKRYEPPEREVEPPRAPQPPEEAAEPQSQTAPEPESKEEPAPAKRPSTKPRARRQTRARTPTRTAKGPEERATGTQGRSRAKRGPEALMRRAVERFNSSEERRKVAESALDGTRNDPSDRPEGSCFVPLWGARGASRRRIGSCCR